MTDTTVDALPEAPAHGIPFRDAVIVWLRVAALSFGGPAGQIAVMHRILVDEKKWIGEGRFLHALNFCMLLPGPEAHQLAIYLGWLLHRTRGGVVAGTLFVLPGFLAMLALSFVYVLWGDVPLVEGLLFGLKAAVLAIVLQAVVRIGGRALRSRTLLIVAAAAFVAIFFFDVPFPLVVLGAALTGFVGARMGLASFAPGAGHAPAARGGLADSEAALGAAIPAHARPDLTWSIRVVGTLLLLWLGPILALVLLLGGDDLFVRLGTFFATMAVVSFGGAYAVLAYVAQAAVETYGWLTPGEMLAGLGLAETTPGPLIMVVQFVGFLAAWRNPGSLDPALAAVLASVLVTWVTFLPSYLWIFLAAPFVEGLRENRALVGALSAITAAVVGVILNLAVWFGLNTIFGEVRPWSGLGIRLDLPVLSSVDPAAGLLTLAAVVAVFRFKLGLLAVLAGSAALGAVWTLVTRV